jgi:hypothetical protein
MNKKVFIGVTSVLLVSAVIGYFLTEEDVTLSDSVIGFPEAGSSSSGELLPEILPNRGDKPALLQTATDALRDKKQNVNEKIPFEQEWCVAFSDLNERDFYYSVESIYDWNLAIGKLDFGADPNSDGVNTDEYQALIRPYREMDEELLVDLAKQGDQIAMQALIADNSFDKTKRKQLAQRLLVLGKTGSALSHLVIEEFVPFAVALQTGSEITENDKTQLAKAVAYANYGLKRSDTSGMDALLIVASSVNNGESPLMAITEDDVANSELWLQHFEKNIDQQRANENLEPIGEVDIPKIAKHKFEFNLAVNAISYPDELQQFAEISSSNVKEVLADKCVQQHMELLK